MLGKLEEFRALINNIAVLGNDIKVSPQSKGEKRKRIKHGVVIYNLSKCKGRYVPIKEKEIELLIENLQGFNGDVKLGILVFNDETLIRNFRELDIALKKIAEYNASKLIFHIRNRLTQPSIRLGKVLSRINKMQNSGKFLIFTSLYMKRGEDTIKLIEETSMNLLSSFLFYTFKGNISKDTYLLSRDDIFIPRVVSFNTELAFVTPLEIEDEIEKNRPFRNLFGNISLAMEIKSGYMGKAILKMDEATLSMKRFFRNIYNIFISDNFKRSHKDMLAIYSYKIPGGELKLPN